MLNDKDNQIANKLLLAEELFKKLRNTSYVEYSKDITKFNEEFFRLYGKRLPKKRKIKKLRAFIEKELPKIYERLESNSLEETNKLLKTEIIILASLFSIDFVPEVIKSDTIVLQGDMVKDIPRRNKEHHTTRMNAIATQGVLEDTHVTELQETVLKTTLKKKTYVKRGVKNIINGARNIIRSGYYTSLEALGKNAGYIYEAKQEACPICSSYHGLKWKKWGEIPLDTRPLIHPNCRCIIHPLTKPFSNSLNAIDSKEWLSMQTKEVQRIIASDKNISISKLHELLR